jgi:protein-S-isoprenylcysteine O-methyltransferase Ste14
LPGLVITLAVAFAVPRADWRAIALHQVWIRILGLVILDAFPVYVVLVEIKLHIEERLMLAEFPDDYPRYRRQVPQLIPGLRLGRKRDR